MAKKIKPKKAKKTTKASIKKTSGTVSTFDSGTPKGDDKP